MRALFISTVFIALCFFPLSIAYAESGMDILNAGFYEGSKLKRQSGSYVTLEQAEKVCKDKACEAGYCDKAIPCNELKYDIFFSACMRGYRN